MRHIPAQVEVWEETITLPTYEVGPADKNPMFLEKRVYQGSSGKVYPYPVIDKIHDKKVDKAYKAVWLENDYLRVMVLPELGGRIQRAYDKTNGYDFVYYNEVIKPALVGLLGPWVSGGIEFNWPQHHRPTTYAPVDYTVAENPDGSKTVCVSEVDQMYGTKGMAMFTLFPDKAYIEIKGQLYNRTSTPQTFLWWANPAVPVNDNTQSIFPTDVHAVMDHGKRAVSKFPIATGTYYKYDYGAGVDISRYKNIPVPTSYMAYHSDYNFVGSYDYGVQAGVLHVADHHISPGKKQWTWGCGDFGQAWDRNLTDENGPYIELMTGVYTDNQPDFTWLQPYEEKTFTQYFMPYKQVGGVKNASTELVMGLEVEEGEAALCLYATARYEGLRVVLRDARHTLYDEVTTVSPTDILNASVAAPGAAAPDLTLAVYAPDGRLMLQYTPAPETIEKVPDPAEAAKAPEEIATCEELYLTGRHIEQYRHATYDPDPYYLEGLRRDPGDIRLNTAWGLLLLRRGQFTEAEAYFRAAIKRLTWKNPNPYDSEAYYLLGLALRYQGRDDEAYDAFYKASWTAAQQEMSFYHLAAIDCGRGNHENALAHIERALVRNGHSLKARALRALLLAKLGRLAEAREQLAANIALDPFDYASLLLLGETDSDSKGRALALMQNRASTFIEVSIDFAEWGETRRAADTLALCTAASPMVKYYGGYYLDALDDAPAAKKALQEAARRDPAYCFPNRLEDILVLRHAGKANPSDAKACYYLGNLWYDKKQYAAAQRLWERSAQLDDSYPTVWRNLSICYYNKTREKDKARQAMETAYRLDTGDARILLELDQLYKRLGVSPQERLQNYEQHREVVAARDDLYTEYLTLLNLLGRSEEAYRLIMEHRFHPLEGGEGKITKQYALALKAMAVQAMQQGDASQAKSWLLQSLEYPLTLGEGKLAGAMDNDTYYLLGLAEQLLGNGQAATAMWERACQGDDDMADTMYYYDQPADGILYQGLAHRQLGRENKARALFHKLVDYGEKHSFDVVQMDYFAVSLPDLQLFEDDLTDRNKLHCNYLIALGSVGLGDASRAKEFFGKVLADDPAHQDTLWLQQLMQSAAKLVKTAVE